MVVGCVTHRRKAVAGVRKGLSLSCFNTVVSLISGQYDICLTFLGLPTHVAVGTELVIFGEPTRSTQTDEFSPTSGIGGRTCPIQSEVDLILRLPYEG